MRISFVFPREASMAIRQYKEAAPQDEVRRAGGFGKEMELDGTVGSVARPCAPWVARPEVVCWNVQSVCARGGGAGRRAWRW
jgi:hypothetical protein